MKKLTLFLVLIFLSSAAVFTFGRDRAVVQPADDSQAASAPQFTQKITGSSEDGFDILVSYPESEPMKCSVSVKVTMFDGSTKSYNYDGTVRNTGNGWAWFGGEGGLKPAPIKNVEITSKSCS